MAKIIRLTEQDLERLVNKVINEQNRTGHLVQTTWDACLKKAGLKAETIGGPMVRRKAYFKKVNGLTYKYEQQGILEIYGNGVSKIGNWKCDSSSPNGIKEYNIKDGRMGPI